MISPDSSDMSYVAEYVSKLRFLTQGTGSKRLQEKVGGGAGPRH